MAAHMSMLLDVVHTGALADPMWTLSYEMVFYLLVTALFAGGVHRRSGTLAIAFGVVAVAAGLVLSAPLLPGPWPAVTACVLFLAGLACLITGRFRTVAAYALGLMALVLLVFGSFVPWFGGAILAVMFTGTALHRWERGTGGLGPVVAAHMSMLLDVVHTGALADPMWTLSYEMVFYLLVTALFAGGVHRRSGTL
ncbi:acyltransferase, partial [Microbispora bryophytorum]